MEQLLPVIMKQIQSGGKVKIMVTGNSMFPLLRHNQDQVVLSKVNVEELKRWDVVLCKTKSNGYVLHRIIGKRGDLYTLRGDFKTEVEYTRQDEIYAIMKSYIRGDTTFESNSYINQIYSCLWSISFVLRYPILKMYLLFKGITVINNE